MDCGRSRAASNDHRVGTFLLARQKDDRRPQISPESNGAEGLARANCATFAALRPPQESDSTTSRFQPDSEHAVPGRIGEIIRSVPVGTTHGFNAKVA